MDKEKEIEEMAVIGCKRNPQAHTAEECAKCGFKQGSCNAYGHAQALYKAGYRKVIYRDNMDELLNEEIKELTLSNKIRKETAKEILQKLREKVNWGYDYPDEPHSPICVFSPFLFEEMEKEYGVEVDE